MGIYLFLSIISLLFLIFNIKPLILYLHQIYKSLIKSFFIIIILLGFITIFNINLKINKSNPTYKEVLTYIV